ncbi:MAG: hypothetical protein IJT82_03425, partial [Schwartzia sp.]|nr:hypothetical protein [Schwartzia sp. (in: firmicutes)]
LEEAISAILPIVAELNEAEWTSIASQVGYMYKAKAAKVTLDGSEMESLNRRLRCNVLGESFHKVAIHSQSE